MPHRPPRIEHPASSIACPVACRLRSRRRRSRSSHGLSRTWPAARVPTRVPTKWAAAAAALRTRERGLHRARHHRPRPPSLHLYVLRSPTSWAPAFYDPAILRRNSALWLPAALFPALNRPPGAAQTASRRRVIVRLRGGYPVLYRTIQRYAAERGPPEVVP